MDTRLIVKDGDLTVSQTQDCTPIAEWAKARQNEGFTGSSDMKLAARIPMVFIEKYLNEHNISFREFAIDPAHKMRMLSDPILAHFRVWAGDAGRH